MPTARLILVAALVASVVPAQTASGYVKIGSDRRELRHSRAARVTDGLDKSKLMIHLILSETALPSKALFDRGKLFDIQMTKTNQIVEFNFHDDAVNFFLSGKEMEGTLSLSRSPNPFAYSISGNVIKGRIETHSPEASANQPPYDIAVTYSAVLEQAVIAPEPAPADAISAARHPASKVYLDFVAALRAGDKARILAAVPPDRRAQMDTADFATMLEYVQTILPSGIKVLRVVEANGTATLTLSGVEDGNLRKGEAEMTLDRSSGKWLVARESW